MSADSRVQKVLAVVAAHGTVTATPHLDSMSKNELVRLGYAIRVWDGKKYQLLPTAAATAVASLTGLVRPGR